MISTDKHCTRNTAKHKQELELELQENTAHLLIVRLQDTGLGEDTLEDELHGNTAWHTDKLGHSRRAAVTVTVSLERGRDSLLQRTY
jgi:hypothetical protein